MTSSLLTDVNDAISTYRLSYYAWSIVFYVLCVAMIVLPIIVATFHDQLGAKWVRTFAAGSAICAGIVAWAALNTVISNFEKSFTSLEIARGHYYSDHKEESLLKAYDEAKITASSYTPGVPSVPASKKD